MTPTVFAFLIGLVFGAIIGFVFGFLARGEDGK